MGGVRRPTAIRAVSITNLHHTAAWPGSSGTVICRGGLLMCRFIAMSEVHRPSGWYPDGTGRQRWWDGQQWGPYAPASTQVARVRPQKQFGIAYLLLILLGGFGAHHFYLGNSSVAATQLALWLVGWFLVLATIGLGWLLVAGVVVWLIVDLFQVPAYVKASNSRL